jgi:hypothetical protein
MAQATNPIISCLDRLQSGQSLEDVMLLRDEQLPTPRAWLEAGWEALSVLAPDHQATPWLVELMQNAWHAAGPVGREGLPPWCTQEAQGSQVALIRAMEQATWR